MCVHTVQSGSSTFGKASTSNTEMTNSGIYAMPLSTLWRLILKEKIIIAIDVLIVAAVIISIVFFTIVHNESKELNAELSTQKALVLQAQGEYTEKTKPNSISTPDQIDILKRELAEAGKVDDEGHEEIKQIILNYVNILYNSEGNFKANKDKITSALKKFVAPAFMESRIESMFSIGGGNGYGNMAQKKVIADFCTDTDIYLTIEEYSDGSDIYTAICALHYENLTQYHKITAANYSGNVMVNSDTLLFADTTV